MLLKVVKILYWLVLGLCISSIVVLAGSGYTIKAGPHYELYSVPEMSQQGVIMQYDEYARKRIPHVTGYVVLGEHVAGSANDQFFLASPTGDIRRFEDRDSWIQACRDVDPAFEDVLDRPSPLKNGRLVLTFCVLLCSVIVLLAGGWGVRRYAYRG